MGWLFLFLALFLASWAAVRFYYGWTRDGEKPDRHTDDVMGQVHDFQRAREALRRTKPRDGRWYANTDDTDEAQK